MAAIGRPRPERPQKFHAVAVPRVGGVGITASLVLAVAYVDWRYGFETRPLGLMLMACALPAFGAGLIEDLTKTVSARWRLLATALSAVLAFVLLDAQITHTDIPGLDWVVSWPVGALMVTVLAVAGIANSVNIIDRLQWSGVDVRRHHADGVGLRCFSSWRHAAGHACAVGHGRGLGFLHLELPGRSDFPG